MRNDKEYEIRHRGYISNNYWMRYYDASGFIKKSAKILLLVAVCWLPNAIAHPDMQPYLKAAVALWIAFTLFGAAVYIIGGHLAVLGDIYRWAKRNMADRKSTILLMLFPGTLMDAWERESAELEERKRKAQQAA